MKTALVSACLCIAFAHAVSAQRDTSTARRNEVAVFAGLSQTQRFDATASPSTFSGRGVDAGVDYTRALGARGLLFGVSLGSGVHHFTPADASSSATERLIELEQSATLLCALVHHADWLLAIGAGVSANFAMTEHQYSDPSHRRADFLMASATFGPAVEFTQSVLHGIARLRLTSPLVGLVTHPYSDTRGDYQPTSVRSESIAALRGVSAAFSFAPAVHDRIGLVYAYRVRVLHFADVQPLRSVSQSLSVGVVERFGGGG